MLEVRILGIIQKEPTMLEKGMKSMTAIQN